MPSTGLRGEPMSRQALGLGTADLRSAPDEFHRRQRVARSDFRAVLRRGESGKAFRQPRERFGEPGSGALDVAEVLVFGVVDGDTGGAVLAGQAAHVTGDHHAVARTDTRLV